MSNTNVSKDLSSSLNSTHRTQLAAYLKFFRAKSAEQQQEVSSLFDEHKEMRLLEEMYSLDEVSNIIDGLKSIVRSQIATEFQQYSHQSTLFLQQLMLQAEGSGVSLSVDTHILEDAVLLSNIDKLELESKLQRAPTIDNNNARQLTAISGAADIKLVQRIKELEENNRSVLARLELLKEQTQRTERDNNELKQQLLTINTTADQYRQDLDNLKSNNKSEQLNQIQLLRAENNELHNTITELKQQHAIELKESESALQSKVNNSKQFIELKKLLLTKNQQLKEVREKLKAATEGK